MSALNGLGLYTVSVKTAAYTVVADTDNGKCFSNAGATGAVTFTLPPATQGQWFRFFVEAAQELRIDPSGTETIALGSTGVQGATGKYLTSSTVGHAVHIVCIVTGTWNHATLQVGTFTQES